MMRRILIISSFILLTFKTYADEGMWLPMLLKELNEKDMKTMGMKISASDIYDINKSSMKDAVVLFGRGCTGELISNEGLLLTNHHCGFGEIQDHSSLEHDYLKDGFWASDRSKELTNPGLTVTFIVRMENVTAKVVKDLQGITDEAMRESLVAQKATEIAKEATAGTSYDAVVKPFYNGNEYYLIVMEIFKDIRLVGAPPSSIGNFGKDMDNWSWPRHTGDFSMFRIYANKDNKPAEYSPDNVPYKPKHHFPISLKGLKEKDFTMVYGFPARTNEYLTSYAVEQLVTKINPMKVDLRGKRLDVFNKYMLADREIFIKYADKYSGVSNYHKKWAGETRGLKKADAVAKKKTMEMLFENRVSSETKFVGYLGLLDKIGKLYSELEKVQPEYDLYAEALLTIEIFRQANSLKALADLKPEDFSTKKGTDLITNLKSSSTEFYKNYHAALDQDILVEMITNYLKYSTEDSYPTAFKGFSSSATEEELKAEAEKLFQTSVIDNGEIVMKWLENPDTSVISKIKNDVAFQAASFYFNRFRNNVQKEFTAINAQLIPLNRQYMEALRVVLPEKKYYPDANQTLRVAFGKTEGYKPNDATSYNWFTTADGIMEKNNTGHIDYSIEPRMFELLKNKDYGRYADKDGTLHTCFAASNHTTGGNSGSPVLNAKGHLIGTNFDRNWEGTMSDIYYDINQVRNIVLDVRYTLWVIDKYAGAGHLIKEMTIIE
jgi:Peptidase S46